jgi:DNA-binding XRE family transcriptional regulator
MPNITPAQIRAARGLLDWSRADLAHKAGLSPRTILNLEKGYMSSRDATVSGLWRAFEEEGIIFPPEGGVRKELPEVKTIEGTDGCDVLFENMLRTVQEKGGEIVGTFMSYALALRSIATNESEALKRLETLKQYANLKFVLADLENNEKLSSYGEVRIVSEYCLGPSHKLVYGNKLVFIQNVGKGDHRTIIIKDPCIALASEGHFYKLWKVALPFSLLSANCSEGKAHIQRV